MPETYLVHGTPAGSINEYNVGAALDQLKLEFDYQVPTFGGRNLPGGQVIDFIVYVPPKPVPLYVQGGYWHGREKALLDLLKQDRVAQIRHWADPVLIWEKDCMTIQQAKAWLQRNLL